MDLTYKTVITWEILEDVLHPQMFAEKTLLLEQMTAAGKTNNKLSKHAGLTYERYWIDQSAAEEYVQWIVDKTNQYHIPTPKFQIVPV